MGRGLVLISIFFAVTFTAVAKKFWDIKAWTEWSRAQVIAVLTDSPWTADFSYTPMRFSGPTAAEQLGIDEFYYDIRWRSSKIMRFALARLRQLGSSRVPEELPKEWVEGYYVIELRAVWRRYEPDLMLHSSVNELEQATLEQLRPVSFLLKKNKQKLSLSQYVPASKSAGITVGALFLFRRSAADGQSNISLADDEVRFITHLPNGARVIGGFKLKNMQFEGALDL